MQRVRVELSTICPGLKVQVLLGLERVVIAHQEQQIIGLHARDLLCCHKLLTLFRVGKIPTFVRGLSLSNLLRIDRAFPEVPRSPFGGFDIVEVENALGDAGAKDRTGIAWTIGLFDLTCVLRDEQRFHTGSCGDIGNVHDLLHTAHPHKFIENQEDRSLDLAPPVLAHDRAQDKIDEQAHEDRLSTWPSGTTMKRST